MLDPTALAVLRAERVDWRFKAIPAQAHGLTLAEWLDGEPRLADCQTPLLTLDADALAHNISAMARWCDRHGLVHAPHGKTTMAPALWEKQLRAGAWAITLANVPQLRVARAFDVPRVILANEIVTPKALRWLAEWIDQGVEITCFVDSQAAVSIMDEALDSSSGALSVCVELGGVGGRAGTRDVDTAVEVAAAVRAARNLRLVGVGGYEGSLAPDASPESLVIVDGFLDQLRELYSTMLFESEQPMLTVGGSQYIDRVAERLKPVVADGGNVVLRSGSYIAHDDGLFARMTPAARGADGPALRPALRVYATVLSRPEPELAVLDAGRRDLPFDAGMPVALDLPHTEVTALNDQHCYLTGEMSSVAVGDVIRLGLSHPCTAFDKWGLIPVVDPSGAIVDAVRTYF